MYATRIHISRYSGRKRTLITRPAKPMTSVGMPEGRNERTSMTRPRRPPSLIFMASHRPMPVPIVALMRAVRHCTLGQISEAFFEVGGEYRRNV